MLAQTQPYKTSDIHTQTYIITNTELIKQILIHTDTNTKLLQVQTKTYANTDTAQTDKVIQT